jgi:tartrate-resistant acid phosphatase type 5
MTFKNCLFIVYLSLSISACLKKNSENYIHNQKQDLGILEPKHFNKSKRLNKTKILDTNKRKKELKKIIKKGRSTKFTKNTSNISSINNIEKLPAPDYQKVRFIAFGDFGEQNQGQALVAKDMQGFCHQRGCDFALTLGDNIYPRGINTLPDGKPDYKQVIDTFVIPFAPLNIPMYMILGNHDLGNDGRLATLRNIFRSAQNIKNESGQKMLNQILFTNNRSLNPKIAAREDGARLWMLPAPFYDVQEKGKVSLIALDTNFYPNEFFAAGSHDLDDAGKQENKRQESWLKEKLAEASGDWKVVMGHSPIFSHGPHGDRGDRDLQRYRDNIIPLLCQNKVDFYLSGHEHVMEINSFRCLNGHNITSIISGAVSKSKKISQSAVDKDKDNKLLWANGIYSNTKEKAFSKNEGVLGFSYFENLDKNRMQVIMKLSNKTATQEDACFIIEKNKDIVRCE